MISFVQDVVDLLVIESRENGKKSIKLDQENNKSFRKRFDVFLEKHKDVYPQLLSFNTFLNNLEPDEMFFILPNIELDIDQKLEIYSHLQSQKSSRGPDEILSELKKISKPLFQSYNITVLGQYRHSIGNPRKKDRVCRFCSRSMPEVTFNKKAHAISEGIGNKTLMIYDECDTCNNRFSETIEPDLIEYFSLYRTIYGIKAKGGKKKIKGINFDLENDGQIQIRMRQFSDRPPTGDKYKIPLHFKEKVCFQNIYRTFVKFFLSLVDENELQYFAKTIQWVNGDFSAKNLPLVSSSLSSKIYTEQPFFTYYIRKNNDLKLPYAVCDFQFICFKYVFIVPFCSQDSKGFLKKEEQQYWWRIFKKFHEVKWVNEDFSSDFSQGLSIVLNAKTNS